MRKEHSPIRMARLPVYILAGGESRRFGSNKARIPLGGTTLIQQIARSAEPVASQVTVVSRQQDGYTDLGLRTIQDSRPGEGPLAGLETALLDCHPAPWLLLLSCDLAGLKTSLLRTLLLHPREDKQVILYASEPRQPLLALYSHSTLDEVRTLLDEGERAMQALLDRCNVGAVPLNDDWNQLRNINSPDDFERYRREQ